MKKCFYFPTWEEQSNVMISLDENKIVLPQKIESGQMKVCVAGWMRNSLETFDEQIDFSNADYWENCKDKYQEAYDELFDDLYKDFGKECDKQFDEIEIREKGIAQSTPSDPIKQKLSELTGAKWYGDYVVFQNGIGNIYKQYGFSVHGSKYDHDKPYYLTYFVEEQIRLSIDNPFEDICISSEVIKEYEMDRNPKKCDKGCNCTQYDKKFNNACNERSINDLDEGHEQYKEEISNIFYEYSLHLQGKENKWEEVKKILKI